MALSQSVQTQISFKHLQGKSHTDSFRDSVNEPYGISFNIPSENIWTSVISPTPSVSTLNGVTVRVLADLTPINGSNGHSFYATWPSTLPNEIDYTLGTSFSYGVGSLVGITAGDRMMNIISDYYGTDYFAVPYIGSGTNPIEGLDIKRWTFQYNSGIFYQDNIVGSDPTTIHVYPYLGTKIQFSETRDNIRITASGSLDYSSVSVSPSISTYSTNHLYLVDFTATNIYGVVNLNVSNLGTYSVLKWASGYWGPLSVNEITVGRVYYLTWNGSHFQFGDTNPTPVVGNFYGGETNNTVGAIISGFSFDGVSMYNMFQNIFYGELFGNIESFTLTKSSGIVTDLEVGDNLPASTMTFSWSLDYPFYYSDYNTFISRQGGPYIAVGISKTSPYTWVNSTTISYTHSTTETFRIDITRTSGVRVRAELDVNWLYPIYYGSTDSATVSSSSGMTKVLASGSNFTLTIPGSGYKYIYVPSSYSSIYSLECSGMGVAMAGTSNGYTFSDTKTASFGTTYNSFYYSLVDIGNAFGVTHSYRVYRSEYQISSQLTITSKDSL